MFQAASLGNTVLPEDSKEKSLGLVGKQKCQPVCHGVLLVVRNAVSKITEVADSLLAVFCSVAAAVPSEGTFPETHTQMYREREYEYNAQVKVSTWKGSHGHARHA